MTRHGQDSVLVVDDDELFRRLLGRQLELAGYEVAAAADAAHARTLLARRAFSLVLCDLNMPGESGLDLLATILPAHQDLAAIVVSGVDDPATADAAAALGVFGYMVKPFGEPQLLINVANALRERRLRAENRAYRERLEVLVQERTAALGEALSHLGRMTEELAASHGETIRRLSVAGEYRDEDTGDHADRVAHLSTVLAREIGLPAERCELLRMASPLHDIGKVGIPDAVLHKRGPLDDCEWAVMQTHAEIGRRILGGSDSPVLDLAATVAWTHHERFDGTGYPRGLVGTDIPVEGRIVAVADVFDALTHDRVYRPRFSIDRAVEMIAAARGTHFDPAVADAFVATLDELRAIAAGAAPSAGPRVLIVEQEAGARERLERVLRGRGCEIVGAVATAAHAVSLMHTTRPDVVVVDLDGAPAAGVDLTRRLAGEPGGPRIVLYTRDGVAADLGIAAVMADKDGPATDLARTVREAAAGRAPTAT